MQGYEQPISSGVHPNVFKTQFLCRMAEQDEPPTAGEADVAGPWRIEAIPGEGFGLFRIGESLGRGFSPLAVFPSQWLALIAAAVLPGTGRDPLIRIEKDADEDGAYPLVLPGLDGREVVGRLRVFDEDLVSAVNVAIHLLQAPESLAWLLEAAGGVALERCGAILDERVGVTAAGQAVQ